MPQVGVWEWFNTAHIGATLEFEPAVVSTGTKPLATRTSVTRLNHTGYTTPTRL